MKSLTFCAFAVLKTTLALICSGSVIALRALPTAEGRSFKMADCLENAGVNRTRLVVQTHSEYTELNYQWNLHGPTIHPLEYFRPESVEEIQAAVRCGHELATRIVPRNGGHSFAKYAFGDENSLVLDLQRLDTIGIDTATGTAQVEAGARIGFVAWALWTRARKILPLGGSPYVGISSALGGGDGALARLHGLTLDNILEIDIVNADGQLVRANSTTNSDLFWSLRGAGAGSLGIVTSFTFKVHDPPVVVIYGTRWYDLDAFPEVYSQWQAIFMAAPPNTLNSALHVSGSTLFLRLYEFSDDDQLPVQDSQVHRIFETLPASNASTVQSLKYAEFLLKSTLFGFTEIPDVYEFDTAFRSTHYKVKSFFVNRTLESSEETWKLYEELQKAPANVIVDMFAAGGRVNEVGVEETSYVHRGQNGYSVHIVYDGLQEPGSDRAFHWMQTFFNMTSLVLKHTESYQNYVDEDMPDYLRRYYGANLDRLVAIKKKYDPRNYFRTPQSIPVTLDDGDGDDGDHHNKNSTRSTIPNWVFSHIAAWMLALAGQAQLLLVN